MASGAQKTPIARSLEKFAERKIGAALDLLGQSLPASVVAVVSSGIVTVKFELTNVPFTLPQVTVPILGAEYVRLPIQTGMKGMVVSADAYLGGMSGLGGGTADLTPRPNLANLAFVPLGSKAWSAVDDPDALVLYGPKGVILRDADSTIVVKFQQGVAEITLPAGVPLTINGIASVTGDLQVGGALQISGPIEAIGGGTYAGDLKTSGDVIAKFGGAAAVGLSTHSHHQPPDSHGDTEQATNPPTGGT